MAEPCNTSSIEKEPELLEIKPAEELIQCLQIDDYVWVNLDEVQQQIDKVESAASSDLTTSTNSIIAQNLTNIVQLDNSDAEIGDKVIENIYYNQDSEIYETDEEELDVDELQFKIESARPVNLKLLYPTPRWMKRMEHGRSRILSNDEKQKCKKMNPLLPKITFRASTTAVLERLINDRYLGKYNEIVGRGKNSVVFQAECHRHICMTMPVNNAVKVYYLTSDKKKNKLIFRRVQREFEHLQMIWKHDHGNYIIPIRAWENVIVMSFIGFESTSPSIEELQNDKDIHRYFAIVSLMHHYYNIVHLVHGKLCAKNIRCWFEYPRFIGWGHSVKTNHPQALPKLIKDCKFVTEFYARRGVAVKSTEDLFKEITGFPKIGNKLLDIINTRDLYERYDQNPNRRSCSPERHNNNLRFKCN